MEPFLLLLAFPLLVFAQHEHGSTSSGEPVVMIPWLHFTPGDAILFKEWVPRKPGPFAGACIALFLLAIVDRMLAAMRRIMEVWWKRKYVSCNTRRFLLCLHILCILRVDLFLSKRFGALSSETDASEKGAASVRVQPSAEDPSPRLSLSTRNAAPFIPAHDFARGGFVVLQSAITYALMLSVMYGSSMVLSPVLMLFP